MARGFARNIAVLIGIDAYQGGIPRLTNAVRDVETIARCLREQHGYEIMGPFTDEQASGAALTQVFGEALPGELERRARVEAQPPRCRPAVG